MASKLRGAQSNVVGLLSGKFKMKSLFTRWGRSYALSACDRWQDLSTSEIQPLTSHGLDHYDVVNWILRPVSEANKGFICGDGRNLHSGAGHR